MRLKKCSYQRVMFGEPGPKNSQLTRSRGIFKESFKRSRQRGINVTLESFASHRRSHDSAVAGIQVKRGTNSVFEILLYKYVSK